MKDEQSVKELVESVEKQFGKGSLRELGGAPEPPRHGVISTGSLALNDALGVGGIPKGVVTEIQGADGEALAVQLVSEAQRVGGVVAYIDANHRLDIDYAKIVGVDVERLLVSQPDNGNQAFDIADVLARSGVVDLMIVDSVDVLAPKAELEGDEIVDGERARLFGKGLCRLTGVAYRTGVAIVFLCGDDRPLPAALGALKFYASVRMQLSVVSDVVIDQTVVVGSRVSARISKNKFAPPFREANFEVRNNGIDKAADLLDCAIENGILSFKGPRHAPEYYFGEAFFARGRETAREAIICGTEMALRIRDALAAKVGRES